MKTQTRIDQWCEAAIEAGWLAAVVLAPLFFNVFSSRVFEPDKISLLRTLALIMLVAWLLKLVNGGPAWLPAFQTNNGSEGTDSPTGWRNFWRIPFLAPILLLILAYGISTLFSVARFVSWWGSYQRLQGTYTFFAYVIIALLVMAHLRSPQQIRRLQYAVIVTSLPIAVYGVIQHYGIDPLPWGGDVSRRIASNAGNAIFLAAYLIMALFLTLERIYSSFAYLLTSSQANQESGQDLPAALAGGAYLFIFMVQGLAIFWTQSRGPLLGLLLGIYVFVLLTLSALRPRFYRSALFGWVGLGVLGIVVLVLMNTTSLFDPLRSVPSLGRLSTLLDQSSNTAQVRLLIWQGASDLTTPHEPLVYPGGDQDSVNAIRPLIGYGPETMWVAFNPFYPPKLAHHEKRNASPDRSHNETWDSFVITGVLGFIAYMSLFISIFYWSLRWLGLLVNRRDTLLFGGLLSFFSIGLIVLFYLTDGSWRFLGVALPAGLEAGLVIYIMLAPFLHPDYKPDPADIPRQLLIVAILSTIAAHFVEIHFGIAIAATRTYFWVLTALLLVLGMRWAVVEPFAKHRQQAIDVDGVGAAVATPTRPKRGKGRRGRQSGSEGNEASAQQGWPLVPSTVLVVQLIFLTFVFIYSTNALGLDNAVAILFNSILKRVEGGGPINSPAILFLMLFTWGVGATIGLADESLSRQRGAGVFWWLRAYALHALIVWGSWLLYGLLQGRRLIPGISGRDLDSQLNLVSNHFAMFTWIVLLWVLLAGTVWAWPRLRDRRLPIGNRTILTAVAGAVLAVIMFTAISNFNIGLVRADIIYKQGQQFDSQRNWVSSIELYRRALRARTTEDHYMLFLGRGLLEQAKAAPPNGSSMLPGDPKLGDVLALEPEQINQMPRSDLLRAAEVVLLEAQRVNPLNTDHTANLARLYRTWADLTPVEEAEARQALLDQSIAQYELAVTLSPNAAHLWNEKGNAHLAQGERDIAEELYLHSLSIDNLYDQTYLLLADFYDGNKEYDKSVELLQDGIDRLKASPRHGVTSGIYSYLGVALARSGDQQGAIDANLDVLKLSPDNIGAMRNLALLYRDSGDYPEAVNWANQAIDATNPARIDELKQLRSVLIEIYSKTGETDQMIAQYELIRDLDPEDIQNLQTLNQLYMQAQDWNKAVDTLRALYVLQPGDYRHPLTIAQVLQQVGQTDEAIAFARQSLDLAPDSQKQEIEEFIALMTGE